MKLINRTEFLALPAGTVYAKWEPCCFGDLQIKGESTEYNDFWYQSLIEIDPVDEKYQDACEIFYTDKRTTLDFHWQGRDGLYNTKQLFAVFESHEVSGLIERLQQALTDGYKNEKTI